MASFGFVLFYWILKVIECFNDDSNTVNITTLAHTCNYLRLKKEVLYDKSSRLEGPLVNALFYLMNVCMNVYQKKASAT